MIVQIELGLGDAMSLVAAFEKDSQIKDDIGIRQCGEAVIEKIADQLDTIVTGLEKQV